MMIKNILKTALFVCLLMAHAGCHYNGDEVSNKISANDPFKNTIVPSEYFEIDADEDNVISGEKGTVIVCPKGCFRDSKGEIFDGNVKIELAEALSIEDMLLSNLTTTSGGKLLETDGMIYFNATGNGDQLTINKDIPIHIEIPTPERKPGMMAYKGSRDAEGKMNWTEPKELDKYLLTVDMNTLDFLPEGFATEVDKGMPFKGHKTATPVLKDSLYFSLGINAKAPQGVPAQQTAPPPQINEAYYNKHKKVKNGKYTDDSYNVKDAVHAEGYAHQSDSLPVANCGIDPVYIKVIKSDKYKNTLIATKEFETRLKVIFNTCNNEVLAYYLHNSDKNLYELDSTAAILLKGTEYEATFDNFAKQRLTKVRDADKYAQLLKGYFENQLSTIKEELEEAKKELDKALEKENEKAQKEIDKYKKLLFKRETFRMETYGFDWTENGWVNIDIGTIPKDWGPQPLQVKIENGAQFDRVYTYVVYTSIKSLYRLNTDDNINFYVGNEDAKEMLMPKQKKAVAIAIGYKGESPSLAVKEFMTGMEPEFSINLSPSSMEKVKEAVHQYEKYAKENKISVDLEFMTKFYKEELRQKELLKESEFMRRLWNLAYPCCADIDGEKLFMMNCSSCHGISQKQVGPALLGITSKRSREWLYQFTRNNEALRARGDKDAIAIFEENGKAAMNVFENLSREEIEAIYKYIDGFETMRPVH